MIDEKKISNAAMTDKELDKVAGGTELDPKVADILSKLGKVLSGTGEDISKLKDSIDNLN